MDITQTAKYRREQAAFISKLRDSVSVRLALGEESSKLWSKANHTSKTKTCLLLSTSGALAARFEKMSSKMSIAQFERGKHSLGTFMHAHR